MAEHQVASHFHGCHSYLRDFVSHTPELCCGTPKATIKVMACMRHHPASKDTLILPQLDRHNQPQFDTPS
jgi:hypothetical protein